MLPKYTKCPAVSDLIVFGMPEDHCENVDQVCVAKDREVGHSAVVEAMNFGVW